LSTHLSAQWTTNWNSHESAFWFPFLATYRPSDWPAFWFPFNAAEWLSFQPAICISNESTKFFSNITTLDTTNDPTFRLAVSSTVNGSLFSTKFSTDCNSIYGANVATICFTERATNFHSKYPAVFGSFITAFLTANVISNQSTIFSSFRLSYRSAIFVAIFTTN
jgi:hypothetical protein